jgi:hypothetical protein
MATPNGPLCWRESITRYISPESPEAGGRLVLRSSEQDQHKILISAANKINFMDNNCFNVECLLDKIDTKMIEVQIEIVLIN